MNGSYRWSAPAHSEGGRLATGAWRGVFRWLYDLTLGCMHRHKSFPFTPVRGPAAPGAALSSTYVVCLDCGKTFDYDWNQMRMEAPSTELPIRGSATVPPQMPAAAIEPAMPRAEPQRYESAGSPVPSLTA